MARRTSRRGPTWSITVVALATPDGGLSDRVPRQALGTGAPLPANRRTKRGGSGLRPGGPFPNRPIARETPWVAFLTPAEGRVVVRCPAPTAPHPWSAVDVTRATKQPGEAGRRSG